MNKNGMLKRVFFGKVLLAACMAVGTAVPATAQELDLNYNAGEARSLAGGAAYYVEQGRGVPVVFFMQGFDHRYWQMQLPAFAGEWRAVALWTPIGAPPPPGVVPSMPLRAGGPSLPGPLAASLPALLEALRSELGVERLHLVTHSISGRLALEAAAARPDLFATLTLLEPAGGIGSLPPPDPGCALDGADAIELQACEFVNIFSGQGTFETLPDPVRQLLMENRRETNAFIASLPAESGITNDPTDTSAASAMFFPICEEIGDLSMPLLFVRGSATTAFYQSGLDHYEQCLPMHDTVVIEGAAHNVHIEQPAAFNAALADFIARHSP